jgi:UDPglucose 6-dehydrogenase
MKIGICGLGKLGLPVALAIESKGHEVMGYDISPLPAQYLREGEIPYQEADIQPYLERNQIKIASDIGELVAHSDILFVPVQTPHQPEYEGVTPIPNTRADFDYTHLEKAVAQVNEVSEKLGKRVTLAVISTCLPGTFERQIKPLTTNVDYVYTPQFIAMGTVLQDYLNPEFNLIGVESEEAAAKLEEFYKTINTAPSIRTDITTAEGIKVSYNTWITAKTVIANMWGEIAERTGMNFDDIKRAWDTSNRRLWSTRYTDAGMSDGGGCHPRDNIAMSWLADEIGLSHNFFDDMMRARDDYEAWHGEVASKIADENGHQLIILGRAFKPDTNIETGSASRLMSSQIQVEHSHVEDLEDLPIATYFIGTKHQRYLDYRFPKGSVVIDPHGYIKNQEAVTIHRLGRA